jgi:hypothetical protein
VSALSAAGKKQPEICIHFGRFLHKLAARTPMEQIDANSKQGEGNKWHAGEG